MLTVTNLNEEINGVVNKALGNLVAGADARYLHSSTDIATALTNAATAVTALATPGPAPTHDRTITDPGSALNPAQP